MSEKKDTILIGAHTSAAGGAYKALLHGQEIGATCIQLFTNNQKTWQGKPITDEDLERWKATRKKTGIQAIMSHDSYLINLGASSQEVLEKSRKAFAEEIKRCHLLEIDYLNFHPGAAVEGTREECLDLIIESLNQVSELVQKGKTRLLIETTAGQGTTVGWQFKDIGCIIRHIDKKIPIGVCIDTCHIFAAGYDIRTKQGWDETLDQFDKEIGLAYLYALHLNDSLKPFGSRRDRHASLGKGEIGIESFQIVMTHPVLKHLPKYLETPDPEIWEEEIALLKDFALGKKI